MDASFDQKITTPEDFQNIRLLEKCIEIKSKKLSITQKKISKKFKVQTKV